MMEHFLDTVETIEPGQGFTHFGSEHLAWLAAFVLAALGSCAFYRHLDGVGRRRMRWAMAALLLLNEAFKTACLLIGGRWIPKYLPLHMCSLNIFLIALHAAHPSRLLGNYLYAVGIPAAVIALIFPSWSALPQTSFMNLHSFTVHIGLALYPLALTAGGDIRPHPRFLLPSLGLALGMAMPVYFIDLALGENFMFLMNAETGNPLGWFGEHMGNHLWGIPIQGVAMLALMYALAWPAWRKARRMPHGRAI